MSNYMISMKTVHKLNLLVNFFGTYRLTLFVLEPHTNADTISAPSNCPGKGSTPAAPPAVCQRPGPAAGTRKHLNK